MASSRVRRLPSGLDRDRWIRRGSCGAVCPPRIVLLVVLFIAPPRQVACIMKQALFPLSLSGNGQRLPCRVRLANTVMSRARGLLFAKPLEPGQGLWILPCNSIHMFGMSYPIDVVYTDQGGEILRIAESVRPWRASAHRPAHGALELLGGQARALALHPGMRLKALPGSDSQ